MKAFIFKAHKWIGIAIAAWVVLQVATGSFLAFGPSELTAAGTGARSAAAVRAPSLERMRQDLAHRHPGHMLVRVVFPHEPAGAYVAGVVSAEEGLRLVAFDRTTGSVVRDGTIWDYPFYAALLLHIALMAGLPGLFVASLLATLAVFLAGSGLYQWWPRRSWSRAFEVAWSAPASRLLPQLHKVVGAAAFPLLLLVTVSGTALALNRMALELRPPPPAAAAGAAGLSLDAGVAAARAAVPDAPVEEVRLPAPNLLDVHLRAPAVSARALHRVRVNLATGRVEWIRLAGQATDLRAVILPIHTGEALGPAGLVLELGTALAWATLALTGLGTWLKRRSVRRARARTAG